MLAIKTIKLLAMSPKGAVLRADGERGPGESAGGSHSTESPTLSRGGRHVSGDSGLGAELTAPMEGAGGPRSATAEIAPPLSSFYTNYKKQL